ncbi:MAG: hypothetical protein DYG92_04995 [Leptolyngbya sp. PLA1]|nr:hypothetical protein [Leptolyngbya sp. PLA1]
MTTNSRVSALGVAAVIGALTGILDARPPIVEFALPDHADVIHPATTELVIRFDQDMSPAGWSICGGGPTFPPLDGQPRWVSPRELRVPVKLAAGAEYALSINCPSARNFRSATGEPAEVHPISFRTLREGEAPPTITPQQGADMTRALRSAIDTRYSYRDLRKVDWSAAFDDAKLEEAGTPAAFARRAASMLAANQDLHVFVEVDGKRLASGRRSVAWNVDTGRLKELVPRWTDNGTVAVGRFDDGVGYVLIRSWGSDIRERLRPAFDAIAELSGAKALVVDVRPNSGGDESLARMFAACFVDEPTVYSRSLIRNPDAPEGWEGPFDRVVEPGEGAKFHGKVAVLIGPACMSSNESFILMMRRAGVRETFGEKTWGSSGNPRPHDLGQGVRVFLPSWKDLLPDGSVLEGVGIPPDHPVEWRRGEGDPVLDAALAWLRGTAKGTP